AEIVDSCANAGVEADDVRSAAREQIHDLRSSAVALQQSFGGTHRAAHVTGRSYAKPSGRKAEQPLDLLFGERIHARHGRDGGSVRERVLRAGGDERLDELLVVEPRLD